MTYLTFHLLFLVPPITVLAAAHRPRGLRYIALLCGIALVYTSPWDNYLVYRGVWSYGTERVVGTIGYVPVEEYLFFILQPVLGGLWLGVAQRWAPSRRTPSNPRVIRRLGAVGGVLVTAAGGVALFQDRTLYAGLILVWAGPVLAGQWYLAGERFLTRSCVLGIGAPSIYLWIADRVAIADGIWSISPRYTIGWEVLGLPVEEAVFFLVTNTLVVQGLLMFQSESSRGG